MHKTCTTVWKVSVFGAFSGANFFPAFGMNMETYRVSPHINSDYDVIRARLTANANTFYAVDVRSLLRYSDTIIL